MAYVAIVPTHNTDIEDGLVAIFDFPRFDIMPAGIVDNEIEFVTPDVWVEQGPNNTAKIRMAVEYTDNSDVPTWGVPGVMRYAVHKCTSRVLHTRMVAQGGYRSVREWWGPIPTQVRNLAAAEAQQQGGQASGAIADDDDTSHYFPIDSEAARNVFLFPGGSASAPLLAGGRYRPVEPEPLEAVALFP